MPPKNLNHQALTIFTQSREDALETYRAQRAYFSTLSSADRLVFLVHPTGTVLELQRATLTVWNKQFLKDPEYQPLLHRISFLRRYPMRLLRYPFVILTFDTQTLTCQYLYSMRLSVSDALRVTARIARELGVKTITTSQVTGFSSGTPIATPRVLTITQFKTLFGKTGALA